MKQQGNVILITGGSSGIGAELAKRFHDLGNRIIITGRREAALRETAKGRPNIETVTMDLANPGDIADFAQNIRARTPAVNVLINNAGIMAAEDLRGENGLMVAEDMVAINLLGPIRLSRALIPHLLRQPDPTIINVTSAVAFVPLPAAPTYSATKAALRSWTLSLRKQLGDAIEVIEFAPPGVQTDLMPDQASREDYLPLGAFMDEVMALFAQIPTPPEILVERVRPLSAASRGDEFEMMLDAMANHKID